MKTTLFSIALFAMALPLAVSAGGNAAAGKEKANVCAGCHGADGKSNNAMFPSLAGQYPSYLVQALKDYKSGARNNAMMAPFVMNMSEQDMEDLAAWFASNDGLYVARDSK